MNIKKVQTILKTITFLTAYCDIRRELIRVLPNGNISIRNTTDAIDAETLTLLVYTEEGGKVKIGTYDTELATFSIVNDMSEYSYKTLLNSGIIFFKRNLHIFNLDGDIDKRRDYELSLFNTLMDITNYLLVNKYVLPDDTAEVFTYKHLLRYRSQLTGNTIYFQAVDRDELVVRYVDENSEIIDEEIDLYKANSDDTLASLISAEKLEKAIRKVATNYVISFKSSKFVNWLTNIANLNSRGDISNMANAGIWSIKSKDSNKAILTVHYNTDTNGMVDFVYIWGLTSTTQEDSSYFEVGKYKSDDLAKVPDAFEKALRKYIY